MKHGSKSIRWNDIGLLTRSFVETDIYYFFVHVYINAAMMMMMMMYV